jgi:hypothetical protein
MKKGTACVSAEELIESLLGQSSKKESKKAAD